MNEHEYLIIKLRGVGDSHVVKIYVGVVVEDVSITRRGKHYFLVFGECEIGFPLEVLEKIADLIDYLLDERTFVP